MIEQPFSSAEEHISADVVIVGAGISGLYCARRLMQERAVGSIVVLERLNRLGGRLDTDLVCINDRIVREEEGGMRFNYGMTELMRLINELELCGEIVPFPMKSPGDTNRFHVRGRSFTAAEAAANDNAIWGELYDLDADEMGLSPTQIVINAYDAVLKENHQKPPKPTTPDFWTKFRLTFTWKGVPMNGWQLWGLLRDMGRSQECIQMLSDTIGFAGPFKAPINAGDAFQILADFPVDPTYYTFREGFSTLPKAVAAELPDQVSIMLSANVDRIVRDGDGVSLTVTEAPGRNSNPHIPGGVTKTVTAGKLILAVGSKALASLFITSPALNRDPNAHSLWDNIHASRGMKLMKINLYFDEAWWQNGAIDPPVQFGPNFSSLPINAVYPFYALSDAAGEVGPAPAALTIYCDFDNTNFWSGLQEGREPFDSPLQREQNNRDPQVMYAASIPVVNEAKRQLQALFEVEVPEPILTSYRLWDGEDDFEFAYHQWRLGVDDTAVREYLCEPVPNVHVCNEAISDMQGWVNGSLRSADLILERALGIGAPAGPTCPEPLTKASEAADVVTGLWGD